MPAQLRNLYGKLKDFWLAFTVPQRTFAVLGVVALVVAAVWFVTWVTKPDMAPVFSGMSAEDTSAVVDQLESDGVKYEITDGGSSVLVPADKVYKIRVELASQGIPSKTDGYELFDDLSVGSTEFQQEVAYKRALESELSETVQAVDGVTTAIVHLAIPEESVFTEDQQDPSASVLVALGAGKELDSANVKAIQNLVAAAVPGLQQNSVRIVDSDGTDLTLMAQNQSGDRSSTEEEISQRIENMLDAVLGKNKSIVTVNSDVTTDTVQRKSETFSVTDDDIPPLSSTKTTEEYQSANGTTAAGVLGPDNIAVPSDETSSGTGTYKKEEETVNNSVNKVTEETTVSPGSLTRQSVSVLVDQNASASLTDDDLKKLVSAAAGIDTDRGDQLAITRAVFDTSSAQEIQDELDEAAEAEKVKAENEREDSIRNAVIAGGLAFIALLWLLIHRWRKKRTQEDEEDLQDSEFASLNEEDEGEPGLDQTVVDAIPPVEEPVARYDPDAVIRQEVDAMADEKPEQVAATIHEWMGGR
ncbi:MAG: flagellar M-ring protein FliF [Ancrocorticia sp.]|jgi:flagellar M-ring protein FliF|nr:flagellar M-ring protein FliF [Ancrocorticia sp.]MCI2178351.1 flagellar M-ring protein FliF [Ancrocorticia sp.]MCI2193157.1 flagellar M-ring protein FliF [Ancrocorticia sp.]MCI2198843.1 flagellar M-ring protein FliF [Ancrocorticia sp.]